MKQLLHRLLEGLELVGAAAALCGFAPGGATVRAGWSW
jgi:hypothetical protein